MTQMCLFCLHIRWKGQTCNARYRCSAGIDQKLTSMPSVMILVRNACSYYVCMRSVVVIQLPTLTAKKMSLHWMLWYLESTNVQLLKVTMIPLIQNWLMQQCLPLFHYSQPPVTSMEFNCYNIFTKNKKNPKMMDLLTTTTNLLQQHMLQAHLKIMLWKASGRWVKRYHKHWVVVLNQNFYTSHCWRRSCSTCYLIWFSAG